MAVYVPQKNKIMDTKICSECKMELPKTKEYFFTKKYKQEYKGKILEYTCFRSTCKKCHSILSTEKNRNKRIKELGCTIETYKETYCKIIAIKKTKYKELLDIPPNKRVYLIRKMNDGYIFEGIEKYKEDVKKSYKKASINRRKYDYGDVDKVTRQMANEMAMRYLPDSRIAQSMGFKVKDIPKEILEVQRNIIFLKREMGLTHSSKKERNI